MYRSFKVKNFRGLRKLEIDSLERVNLIAGKNNVGKTALLEALWIHSSPNDPFTAVMANHWRRRDTKILPETLNQLFWQFDTEGGIELLAHGDWGKSARELTMHIVDTHLKQFPISSILDANSPEYEANALFESTYDRKIIFEYIDENDTSSIHEGFLAQYKYSSHASEDLAWVTTQASDTPMLEISNSKFLASRHSEFRLDARWFGKLQLNGKHHKIESIMRGVEPRLQGLSVIANPSLPTIHAELEGHDRLLPMPLLGDGMTRLLSLALAIGNSENGLVLIDEIENGLHHSVMKSVWSGIAQFAREFNVQIFATTHSWECIRAAHQAFSEDELYDFRLHRLERVRGSDDTRAVTYTKETLDIALHRELEVR